MPAPNTSPLPSNRFLEVDVAVRCLLDCETPMDSIPHGTKENVFVVITNERNVQRRQKGQRSEFVDDCGVWDSVSGASPMVTYIAYKDLGLSGLTKVYLRHGFYCKQHLVSKVVRYIIYVYNHSRLKTAFWKCVVCTPH